MEEQSTVSSESAASKTPRSQRIFQMLSRVNGWSLAIVGGLSLVVSAVFLAAAGIVLSLALVLHGVFEIVLSRRAASGELKSPTRKMAFNQVGLAVSLTLYFAYQTLTIDGEALVTGLMESPVYEILMMYPEDFRIWLIESLPSMLGTLYLVAALVSWFFCGGTAVYYWLHGKPA